LYRASRHRRIGERMIAQPSAIGSKAEIGRGRYAGHRSRSCAMRRAIGAALIGFIASLDCREWRGGGSGGGGAMSAVPLLLPRGYNRRSSAGVVINHHISRYCVWTRRRARLRAGNRRMNRRRRYTYTHRVPLMHPPAIVRRQKRLRLYRNRVSRAPSLSQSRTPFPAYTRRTYRRRPCVHTRAQESAR